MQEDFCHRWAFIGARHVSNGLSNSPSEMMLIIRRRSAMALLITSIMQTQPNEFQIQDGGLYRTQHKS